MTEHRMTPTAGRTALMDVNMQNAFCTDGGSIASIGLDIFMQKAAIAPCARLIKGARAAGIPVVYTRYIYRADYADGGVLVKYLLSVLGDWVTWQPAPRMLRWSRNYILAQGIMSSIRIGPAGSMPRGWSSF